MSKNSTMGAPPGTMTNGRRAPNFHGPKDCNSDPMPHTRNVALIRLMVRSTDRFNALLTRKTEVIGEAAMTSTCCKPNGMSLRRGNIWSTGWIWVACDIPASGSAAGRLSDPAVARVTEAPYFANGYPKRFGEWSKKKPPILRGLGIFIGLLPISPKRFVLQ